MRVKFNGYALILAYRYWLWKVSVDNMDFQFRRPLVLLANSGFEALDNIA
ncbi:hypothetical protein SAMN05444483_101200 [Salegentibacter echinorum]|uniref:Uncharacterized protein n=1 Tax=Salegentibacter echinorum TaxID=1073325 RepID=A0A1M5BUZ7_SALEC|nr:hypothetical protein SAMN05444483_101200 [Salegentibacter echinorum]